MPEGYSALVRSDRDRDKAVARIRNSETPFVVAIGTPDRLATPKQIRYAHALVSALSDGMESRWTTAEHDAKLNHGVWRVWTDRNTGDRRVEMKEFRDYTYEEMSGFLPAMEAWLAELEIDYVNSDWKDEWDSL